MATVKKKGLGKGLDSLITDKVTKSDSTSSVKPKSEHAADAVMMEISKVKGDWEKVWSSLWFCAGVTKLRGSARSKLEFAISKCKLLYTRWINNKIY